MPTDFPPEADRRTLRVRGDFKLHRTLRSRGDANQTNAAPRLPLVGASALAPFPLSMLFLFRGGGDFFKIEWAETGLGRASSKEEAVGNKFNIEPRVIFIASGSIQRLGVHPRHPPRTFPLGLLAPRCLGLALLLALPPCGAGARAPCYLGEGRNPSPSFGLLLAEVCVCIQCFIVFIFYFCFVASFGVPSESALAQPPSTFSI